MASHSKYDFPDSVLDRSQFKFSRTEILRFGDLDANHHVNNVAYFDLGQSARAEFLVQLSEDVNDLGNWVVVKQLIDYIDEITYPATVDVACCVLRIGRTSCSIGQAFFVEGVCKAVIQTIIVNLGQNRLPEPFPEALRKKFESQLIV